MFRKLTENDRATALDYLMKEPAYNLFAIGDIENYGFDSDFQEVWGDFDDDGRFRSLLLRYYNNIIVYATDEDFDKASILDFMKGMASSFNFLGKEWIVERLSDGLGVREIRRQYLAEMTSAEALPDIPAHPPLEWATLDTFEEVLALRKTIAEFSGYESSDEGMRQTIRTQTGRTVMLRQEDRVVATASSVESSKAAMIIGVCTEKAYRGRGYATLCMAFLCRVLLKEGKIACLFYDNPDAARIYKRLGFRDLGRWATARKAADGPR